ncbi:MAG: MBL fold metallo-hydrolase [Polaribacter sp.]|nr:MBL fold metallo-hydrolase [Polaribacter sp.]
MLIEYDNFSFVIDCGPDFRQQILRENVQDINGILFTHEHSDHTAGLDDIRPFSYKMGDVPIFADQRTLQSLQKRFEYIFSTTNRYPGAPKLSANLVGKNPFDLDGVVVTPIEVLHGKLPITCYRFGDVAYITDIKTITAIEKQKLKSLKTLIVSALRIEEHPTHFNLQEALDFVAELQPERTYFTHISHKLGYHEAVEKTLPDTIFLAYDGLVIEI